MSLSLPAQILYTVQKSETLVDTFNVQGIDSIQFSSTYARICKKDATTKTLFYSSLDYMTFTDPELITKVPDYIYVPYSYRSTNFLDKTGDYYLGRCKESQHFILFWQPGFGNDPTTCATTSLLFNPQTVLNVAENAWTMYVDSLKFLEEGKSKTDKYKMMMFMNYTSNWVANGSGQDDVIGTLNLSPWAAQSGATVAHEIGHTFQYQTHCDIGSNLYGFMYVLGSGTGNGYWEQTAQWQAYQLYPGEAFSSSNFGVFTAGCYHSPFHEDNRYANYFIDYYWAYKRGADMVGRIWRNAKKPEDPAQAYMRLNGITLEEYNDETWDMAARWATWDIPAFKSIGKNYQGAIKTNLTYIDSTGYWIVNPENCIEDHGFNIIPLDLPDTTTVTAYFNGVAGAAGYRNIGTARAGWRSGFVALLNDGSRVYSSITRNATDTLAFEVPAGTKKLWFVVSSAPKSYKVHSWDDNAANDEQWPYEVKFRGTDCYQTYTQSYSTSTDSLTTTATFNINLPYDASNYTYVTVQANVDKIAKALGTTSAIVTSGFSTAGITFYGVNANGTAQTASTANAPGHWFNASGNVCSWGTTARVYSECSEKKLSFNVGQYPGRCSAGSKFTIRQKMTRTDATDGKTRTVLYVFNVRMVN